MSRPSNIRLDARKGDACVAPTGHRGRVRPARPGAGPRPRTPDPRIPDPVVRVMHFRLMAVCSYMGDDAPMDRPADAPHLADDAELVLWERFLAGSRTPATRPRCADGRRRARRPSLGRVRQAGRAQPRAPPAGDPPTVDAAAQCSRAYAHASRGPARASAHTARTRRGNAKIGASPHRRRRVRRVAATTLAGPPRPASRSSLATQGTPRPVDSPRARDTGAIGRARRSGSACDCRTAPKSLQDPIHSVRDVGARPTGDLYRAGEAFVDADRTMGTGWSCTRAMPSCRTSARGSPCIRIPTTRKCASPSQPAIVLAGDQRRPMAVGPRAHARHVRRHIRARTDSHVPPRGSG